MGVQPRAFAIGAAEVQGGQSEWTAFPALWKVASLENEVHDSASGGFPMELCGRNK